MSPVSVTYIGGHAAVEIDVREFPDDPPVWLLVEQGATVQVPTHVAHGAPAVPGAQIVDGQEVALEVGAAPVGEVVLAPVVASSGLLDQPDQWKPAKAPKPPKPEPEVPQ